jgi:hypothetical protein
MAPLSPYMLGVLICVFFTSNIVSCFALPKFTFLKRLDGSLGGSARFLERKYIITKRAVDIEDGAGATTSDVPWTTITLYQTINTASTQPAPPIALSNSLTQGGSRRFPTNTITTFATPSFFNVQTLTLTQTITTIFVLSPSRSSVIVNVETITTVSTSTSTGYNCKLTPTIAAPTGASKVILSGISV